MDCHEEYRQERIINAWVWFVIAAAMFVWDTVRFLGAPSFYNGFWVVAWSLIVAIDWRRVVVNRHTLRNTCPCGAHDEDA